MRKIFTLFITVLCCAGLANATEGALPGAFTINKYGDQVVFSKGNLQFNAARGTHSCVDGTTAKGTWRFAERQYDFVGDATIGSVYEGGNKCNNLLVDENYNGWIDNFGWGTSGYDNTANDPRAIHFQPWDTSSDTINIGDPTETAQYNPYGYGPSAYIMRYSSLIRQSRNYDWGVYNSIENGGNAPDLWRSLSGWEWDYIITKRPNADKLRNLAYVCGVNGALLFPDNFKLPNGLSFTEDKNQWANNVYDEVAWQKLEAAGAVFLPAAGTAYTGCDYWTSGDEANHRANMLHLDVKNSYFARVLVTDTKNESKRYFVRLAQDIPHEKPDIASEKTLTGVFSVSDETKVNFSQGNLQCYPTTNPAVNTWQFAENQFDILGKENENIRGRIPLNTWIDLFTWGSGDDPVYKDDIYAPFTEWGLSGIENGGGHEWRTMTKDEWIYLFRGRENAENLFGLGKIGTISGLILLPDEWSLPSGAVFYPATSTSFYWDEENHRYGSDTKSGFNDNSYTTNQWRLMEAAGAVFLPAALFGFYEAVLDDNIGGGYWSSDGIDGLGGFHVSFYADKVNLPSTAVLSYKYGSAVRMVKEVEVAPKALTGRFSVAADKQVIFSQGNLRYKASSNEWSFANSQYSMIGYKNENIAANYSGWIDLFGWGTGNNPVETSKESAPYASYSDWTANPIVNGNNETWYTLSAEEWNYLLNTRPNAANLKGQAVVNDIKGYILLPDNWTTPLILTFTPTPNDYTTNVYTLGDWELMEAAGAVFLPAAGYRYGIDINGLNAGNGYYWTSTPSSQYDDMAQALMISKSPKAQVNVAMSCNGYAVRPAREVKANEGIEQPTSDSSLKGRANKVLRDGVLFIERNGKTYNAQGAEVR